MNRAVFNGVLLATVLIASSQPLAAADCQYLDALDTYANSETAPSEASCTTYLTAANTTGRSCHWTFPFRSDGAKDFGKTLWKNLTSCRAGTPLGPDAQVNHPDSYDLREWATDHGTYALSIKDKGALNRTLVFLRLEPN